MYYVRHYAAEWRERLHYQNVFQQRLDKKRRSHGQSHRRRPAATGTPGAAGLATPGGTSTSHSEFFGLPDGEGSTHAGHEPDDGSDDEKDLVSEDGTGAGGGIGMGIGGGGGVGSTRPSQSHANSTSRSASPRMMLEPAAAAAAAAGAGAGSPRASAAAAAAATPRAGPVFPPPMPDWLGQPLMFNYPRTTPWVQPQNLWIRQIDADYRPEDDLVVVDTPLPSAAITPRVSGVKRKGSMPAYVPPSAEFPDDEVSWDVPASGSARLRLQLQHLRLLQRRRVLEAGQSITASWAAASPAAPTALPQMWPPMSAAAFVLQPRAAAAAWGGAAHS